MVFELIKKNRSYRRFDASRELSYDLIRSFIESAGFAPSGANLQRLRFTVVNKKEVCDEIFPALKFAGYLKEWAGPAISERPASYVIISSESELDTLLAIDLGIAAEAILLTACEAGVGGCMLRAFTPEVVKACIPSENQIPHMVIALGYPAEKVILTDSKNGDIKYYRDENDNHVVPKLPIDELIL